jgi:hypothetical protein
MSDSKKNAARCRNRPLPFDGLWVSHPIMQYLLLIYTHTDRWSALSIAERNQIHADCGAWHEDLIARGITKGAMALQPPATATTVAQEEGEIRIMDGPYAETKEFLGGFEIVDCRNLDEAITIAKRFPALRAGSRMEVRPLVEGPCKD